MTCCYGAAGMWEALLLRRLGTLMANKRLYDAVAGLLNVQQDSWGCKTLPQKAKSHMTRSQMAWCAQRAGY